MTETCGLLKKALQQNCAGKDRGDPTQLIEKTVNQLCGSSAYGEWGAEQYSNYRFARAQGLNMTEAKHAVQLALVLESTTAKELIHRLDHTESPSQFRVKRKRQKSGDDAKKKKPKL